MPPLPLPQLAVSSWSLHRRIGLAYPDSPSRPGDGVAMPQWGKGDIAILDLPGDVKRHGFDRVEICHFQLQNRDPGYLSEMRAALKAAGVTLQTLLIDDGDISLSPGAGRDREIGWVGEWIDAAAALGAASARVVAGKQPPSQDALDRSVEGLRQLARRGQAIGVRIVTENWFALTRGPAEVTYILDQLGGDVGLLADTGNWSGAGKYDDLRAIFARAERCHAKGAFGPGQMLDRDDFSRALNAAIAAGYHGPLTLVFDDEGDEWQGIEREREAVREIWASAA